MPRVINTDKNPAYGEAIAELKKEGRLPKDTQHRQVKYLNNRLEGDHGKLKRLIQPTLGFQLSTAATNQSTWRRKSRPSQCIFLSEDRFFVRPARTASSSRPAVSTAVARGGGQGGPKGTA